MKKILVTGAALLLAGSFAAPVSAATDEPGVTISGNARARAIYKSDYQYGNDVTKDDDFSMDSRVRFDIKGVAAGGAYAIGRIRLSDSKYDGDTSYTDANNLWADKAYIGIPFTDEFTVETGKYRVTYGNGFLYDDIGLSGIRGIYKTADITVIPFFEIMSEGQVQPALTQDRLDDNDTYRYGANVEGNINPDWKVGLMVAGQTDYRKDVIFEEEGIFGTLYTKGKFDAIGIEAELSYQEDDLTYNEDDGFGGYVRPSYTMDALTVSLDLGFTVDGLVVDPFYGFVMIGGEHPVQNLYIGDYGDWFWVAPSVTYQVSEALSLTGNLVYATIDSESGNTGKASIDDAWELSGNLKYTISKGADFYWYVGYLAPSFDDPTYDDDAAIGSYAKFEIKF